jgi:class 3 adenylate cyclase
MSLEEVTAYTEAERQSDISDLLSQISVPTMIVFSHFIMPAVLPLSREVARLVPGAEFVEVGAQGDLTPNTQARWLDIVDTFLRGGSELEEVAESTVHTASALRIVLFTDLVGHTEMMSRLGDTAGRGVLREHERVTRKALAAHGGAEVKTMGDGFMASFGSVANAVECAIDLQKALTERNSSAAEPLSVRVGINAGEPIEEDGDLFGATVILAARIAARAEGGEILVADTVRGLCSGKGFLFSDHGEFVAKGFEEPVRVFEVSWQDGR